MAPRHTRSFGFTAASSDFNHGTQAARSQVTLRRTGAGAAGAVDMTTGQAVDTASDAGSVRVEAALDPGAVQVLRVTTR